MTGKKDYSYLFSMGSIILKGDYESKAVWIDEKILNPGPSQKLYKHSQEGFNWGSSDDGASQLALAILFELTKNKKISMILHHLFKSEFISPLRKADFKIIIDAGNWFKKNISKESIYF